MKKVLPNFSGNVALISAKAGKNFFVLAFVLLISLAGFAHSVDSYSASCGAGPQYTVTATISNVNSTSNYRWQWKNTSGAWVCFVNGANTINGTAYNVSGAVYNLTTVPGPIVFTNPNSGLQGLEIRMVISDGNGVDPCTLPAGNTWTSTTNHFINVNNTPCGASTCNGRVTNLYFNELNNGPDLPITNGSTFTVAQLASLYNLEAGTSGTIGSVKYTITGPTPTSNIENTTPYNSPGTGSGAWTGAVGTYTVNLKTYSAADATGNLCHDTTITFNLTTSCIPTTTVIAPLAGVTCTNTFEYNVCQSSCGQAISHWVLQLPACFSSSNISAVYLNNQLYTSWTVGTDPTCNVFGLKVDNPNIDGGTCKTIKIVFTTLLTVGTNNWTAKIATNCFSGGSIAAPASCTACTANNGSIGDRVWLDANGNGLQDATETGGITGVLVQLRNSVGTVIATTNTNASGNYLFSGLAAGTYSVAFPVSLSGSVVTTANVGSDDNIDSDPSQTTGVTPNIVLAAGQNITNVDAGYCPVNLQLGNRVWYDTNNNGINDASENGIRNITVSLYKDDNNDNVADGAALATVLTDVNGNYLFSNLAPGNYIAGAVIPAGYMSSAVNGGDPDNNTDLDDNGQVAVGSEIRGLAITLTGGAEPTSGNTNNTYDFGLLPDCNCTTSASNLLVNGNFENGTTGWSWSGGTLTTGTGYIACGAANGFNNWSSGTSKVYQDVAMAAGSTVTFNAFAGTHTPGITCSPTLSLIFLNAANTVLGQSNVTVTRDVDINNSQLEQYSITAVAPAGTTKVRVQSSITCNTMKMDAFCLTSDNVACVTCALGYPDNSNLPKSGVVFNENEVLRAMEPSSTTCGVLNSGFIKLWYSDEHALFLGVDSVVVKRPNGSSYSTKYPITQYGGTPTCASNLLFGTTINTGAQSGNDVAAGGGRPIRPVLFITDLTVNGNTSRVGDWQQGGTPYNPTSVCGNWKSGYKFVDSSRNPVVVQINPYNDPAPNISGTTWNLGGGEQPPAGTTNQSYGSLVKWDINSLGLIPGHTYRIQVMVHDGDQNKAGGDAGSMCTTIYVPPALGSIGDRVWEDLNRDGIQDAGEAGISGVTVKLYDNTTNTVLATTVTNASGNYLFSNLATGAGTNYQVGFTLPSAQYMFSPNNGAVTDSTNSDANTTTGRSATITLTNAAPSVTYVDAGMYRLININGHVWNDANGLTDLQINKTGIAAIPNSLNIYLVDVATNLIVQAESINPDGTYSFLDVDINHSYKIVLSTVVAFPGQSSPVPFLPSGWQRVGENLGAGPLSGSDGVPNGILFLDTETSDVFDANFGIRVSGGEIIVG